MRPQVELKHHKEIEIKWGTLGALFIFFVPYLCRR